MLTCRNFRLVRLAIISAAALLLSSSIETNEPNKAAASPDSSNKSTTNKSTTNATPAALDGKNSFRLLQHSRPSGEDEVLVSPLGIKVTNLRNNYVSLLPKPFTEVYSYNVRTKKIFHGPLKDHKSPYANSMALLKSVTFDDIKTTKYKDDTYKGCSAAYSNIPKDVMAQRQKEKSNGDLVGRAPRLFEMVTSSKLKVPQEAAHFLYHYYGLPEKPGLPLKVEYTTFSRQIHQYLTTDKIEGKSFKPSDFSAPTNLNKVKNTGEVMLDDDSSDSMKLMIMDH
jgi:hypothetical protein